MPIIFAYTSSLLPISLLNEYSSIHTENTVHTVIK